AGLLTSPLPTAVWGDAAIWVPWALFQHDGDLTRLAGHADLMRTHANTVAGVLEEDGTWRKGFQFGDWLDPAAPPEDPADARTPREVVATACAYRAFTIPAEVEDRLGESSARWRELAERVKAGFLTAFVNEEGVTPPAATGAALAIAFDLVDGAVRQIVGDQLAGLVR